MVLCTSDVEVTIIAINYYYFVDLIQALNCESYYNYKDFIEFKDCC